MVKEYLAHLMLSPRDVGFGEYGGVTLDLVEGHFM
jgi:hypothetical protein